MPALDAETQTRITQLITEGLPGAKAEFAHSQSVIKDDYNSCTVTFPFGKAKFTFTPKNNEIFVDSIEVLAEVNGRTFQGQGIGKKFLSNLLKVAEEQNISGLSLKATDIGAYMWARAGFTPALIAQGALRAKIAARMEELQIPEPDKARLTRILQDPEPTFLWAIADDPVHGFTLLQDQDYTARLDLSPDHPQAKTRFLKYAATLTKDQEKAIAQNLTQLSEQTR